MDGNQSNKNLICDKFIFGKTIVYFSAAHNTSKFCYREGDWGPGDENRLRELISRLKMDRSRVRDTIVELESVQAESLSTRLPVSLAEARKLDLETAVLMQVKFPSVTQLLQQKQKKHMS